MATSFVHLGDFHAAPGPRNADRYRALDQVITDGLALPTLGAWLWPGDLSHARQTIDDKNAIAARLQRMADRAPVLICAGNHDLPGDLDVFARLAAPHPIYVISRPECIRIRLASMAFATIFVLPYPTKAGLTAMGIAPADVIDEAAAALEHIFMSAAGALEAARAHGDLTLMIGHVNVGGAITSTGQPNIGREIEISHTHLDRLGPIYKGLNHIHVAQEIAGAFYAGSLCRLSWGEIEPKRWIQVDIAADPDLYPAVYSHPVDVAPMYHVEGVLTRDRFNWLVKDGPDGQPLEPPRVACKACGADGDGVKDPIEGTLPCVNCKGAGGVVSFAGCEIRVRYRFNASEKRILEQAKAQILATFAEASRLELEPVAVPDRALRAPEVAAAKTLPDKLRAWADLSGAVLGEGVLAKLQALEHGDVTTTLTDVAKTIDALTAAHQTTEVAA